MQRITGLLLAFLLLVIFAYLSRFWIFDLWGRDGLFDIKTLRSGGDLWRRWMRGFGFGVYDLVLWAVGVFFVLTLVQKLWDRVFNRE